MEDPLEFYAVCGEDGGCIFDEDNRAEIYGNKEDAISRLEEIQPDWDEPLRVDPVTVEEL